MKQSYSIILLFAFLIGAIQPIVPLLEYHIFNQSIIELLCEKRDVPESNCNGICYLGNQIEESQEKQSDLKTFFASYYPGGIPFDFISEIQLLSDKLTYDSDYNVHALYNFPSIDLPPPRLS